MCQINHISYYVSNLKFFRFIYTSLFQDVFLKLQTSLWRECRWSGRNLRESCKRASSKTYFRGGVEFWDYERVILMHDFQRNNMELVNLIPNFRCGILCKKNLECGSYM